MVHAHLREYLVRPQHALDHDLDAAAGSLASHEARVDDASIVQHDHIAARDEAGQVAERPVGVRSRDAVEMKEPARAAHVRRKLRDHSRGSS